MNLLIVVKHKHCNSIFFMQLKLFTRNNLKRLYFKYFFTGQNFDMTFVLEDKKKQIGFRFTGLPLIYYLSLPPFRFSISEGPKNQKALLLQRPFWVFRQWPPSASSSSSSSSQSPPPCPSPSSKSRRTNTSPTAENSGQTTTSTATAGDFPLRPITPGAGPAFRPGASDSSRST